MEEKIEQRVCIKFCVKNGFNCADTRKMLVKCYGDSALSYQKANKWFNRFVSGQESVEDDPRFQSKKKAMLTVFMDYNGVVHHEFLPDGQTVNKEYYLGVMRRLREAIRKKRPQLWQNNSWILHHDNAPSHNAHLIREFLAKNNTITIQQPANSPDLAPCDFFLFDRVKKPLRGTRFTSKEEVMEKSLNALKAIPKTVFQNGFRDWIKRWHKCVAADGDYFEGDNIDLDE